MEKRPSKYLTKYRIQKIQSLEDYEFLEALRNIIRANIRNTSFNVLFIANELAISERQLNRKTKSIAGITIGNFIRETKLTEAKYMLEKRSHNTIAEIAQAIGFKKPSYFSKIYTDRFGKRPIEYSNNSEK